MKRFILSFLVSALLVAGFAGCASNPVSESITIQVTSCAPAPDRTDAIVLTLRFANESVYSIGLLESDHRFFLNDTLVGEVKSAAPIGIPPMGTASMQVVIPVSNPSALRQIVAQASDQSVSYRLDSTLKETFNEDDFKARMKSSGSLDVRPLAQ